MLQLKDSLAIQKKGLRTTAAKGPVRSQLNIAPCGVKRVLFFL